MEIFEISYKLYIYREKGYECFGQDLELQDLYVLLKETMKKNLLKRFLIIQKVNGGECPIFYGENKEDFARFKNEAFIPYVRPKRDKVKEKKK